MDSNIGKGKPIRRLLSLDFKKYASKIFKSDVGMTISKTGTPADSHDIKSTKETTNEIDIYLKRKYQFNELDSSFNRICGSEFQFHIISGNAVLKFVKDFDELKEEKFFDIVGNIMILDIGMLMPNRPLIFQLQSKTNGIKILEPEVGFNSLECKKDFLKGFEILKNSTEFLLQNTCFEEVFQETMIDHSGIFLNYKNKMKEYNSAITKINENERNFETIVKNFSQLMENVFSLEEDVTLYKDMCEKFHKDINNFTEKYNQCLSQSEIITSATNTLESEVENVFPQNISKIEKKIHIWKTQSSKKIKSSFIAFFIILGFFFVVLNLTYKTVLSLSK